jgi:hypothetical protein
MTIEPTIKLARSDAKKGDDFRNFIGLSGAAYRCRLTVLRKEFTSIVAEAVLQVRDDVADADCIDTNAIAGWLPMPASGST